MKILGARVKFSRQLSGPRKAPGSYAERDAAAPVGEGESFGDCVQRAFVDVKKQICTDLTILPNHELK
jgi:hypothetical protein